MIELPDVESAFDHENAFYLTCSVDRIRKLLAHWEIMSRALEVPGSIVECGVFKGASLIRWAMFREILDASEREIVAFDTFAEFPAADLEEDEDLRRRFVEEAGSRSIGEEQIREILARKGLDRGVELVAGDIRETVPRFVRQRPDLRVSLLHLDVDLYEPSKAVLEHLYPCLQPGGILLLDDYGTFPGETRAVDECFADADVEIRRPPHHDGLHYIVKEPRS